MYYTIIKLISFFYDLFKKIYIMLYFSSKNTKYKKVNNILIEYVLSKMRQNESQ